MWSFEALTTHNPKICSMDAPGQRFFVVDLTTGEQSPTTNVCPMVWNWKMMVIIGSNWFWFFLRCYSRWMMILSRFSDVAGMIVEHHRSSRHRSHPALDVSNLENCSTWLITANMALWDLWVEVISTWFDLPKQLRRFKIPCRINLPLR